MAPKVKKENAEKREGWEDGTPPPHRDFKERKRKQCQVDFLLRPCVLVPVRASPVPPQKRNKTDNPREGWENGTPPPHRDFKERGVVR